MGTVYHQLRPNAGVECPSRFVFYDTETDWFQPAPGIKRHILKLGQACYHRRAEAGQERGEDWLEFTAPAQLWDWVESKLWAGTSLTMVAHNQQFDFLIVDGFAQLARRGWRLGRSIIDNGLFIVRFSKGDRHLELLDTLNWFKVSLRELGRFAGVSKGEVDFATASLPELSAYCRTDVQICRNAVLRWLDFLSKNDLGVFQPTIAAQAFAAYRHRFMSVPIYIHAHKKAITLERNSYRGGRNECFRIGEVEERVHYLDFNSLYPSVMRDSVFPTRLRHYYSEVDGPLLSRLLEAGLVILDASFIIDEPAIAMKGERLLFPVGHFRQAITSPEIEYVLAHGRFTDYFSAALYEGHPIFHDYVQWFYRQRLAYRQAGNETGQIACKYLLNALYGKFGQKAHDVTVIGQAGADEFWLEDCLDAQTRKRFTLKCYGGKVFRTCSADRESYNSFPALASFVTAYARQKLWSAIVLAGRENVLYCDTDSLFVNDRGLERLSPLIDPHELGALKLVHSGDGLFIHGCKDYVFNELPTIKGIRKNAVRLSDDTFQQDRFSGVNSMLRAGVSGAVDVATITKTLQRDYKKGRVLAHGQVIPFSLSWRPEQP